MEAVFGSMPALSLVALAVIAIVILQKPLRWLLRFLLRSAVSLGLLALWAESGFCSGLCLGVNAFNAAALGLLGVPGLGLLLTLRLC